ncbi:MAG: RlmE family RNA methyltransferase [Alphaproteobacteria bacterium]|nr:RlmE family RNA methyltransferase [Alphaproteobacteria bacterium]
MASVRVKSAKGRPIASTRWLQRQLNDPYVAEAQRRGYRSRAAFKLAELDDRFKILKPGQRVVDLGAAPGGWSQVAAAKVGRQGHVVAVDLQPVEPISGVEVLQADFLDEDAPDRIRAALGGAADLVLSDMAPHFTGHARTDYVRTAALAETAYAFAAEVLAPGGGFVCKVLSGGAERELLEALKRDFRQVRHAKPPSSRKESSEMYVVATGFRGGTETSQPAK